MKICCIDPTYDEIIAAIASARQKTEDISDSIVNDLYYQYGYCERPEHHVLSLYEAAATAHLNELSAGVEPCLKCEEIRNVVEGIRGIVGQFCDCSEQIPELEVDKSEFTQWAIDHPDCVPFKTWETAIYAECNRVGLRIVVENLDLTCRKIKLHHQVTEVLCKIPHQKLVEEILCDVEIKPKPVSADCEIAYKLLPEEVKCKVDIDTFATLIDCGVGTELIAQSIECGLGFDITSESVTICETEPIEVEADTPEDCCPAVIPLEISCVVGGEYECLTDVPAPGVEAAEASGGCGTLEVVFVGEEIIGSCPTTIERTYGVTDVCGTYVECVQTITVNDTIPPTIVCEDQEYQCIGHVPPVLDLFGITYDDNCPGVTILPIIVNATGACPRVITRTYRATDACGNTAQCTQTITVFNTESPDCDIC